MEVLNLAMENITRSQALNKAEILGAIGCWRLIFGTIGILEGTVLDRIVFVFVK